MNIDVIFKLAAVGILVAISHQVLETSGKKEYAQLVTVAGVAVVFLVVVQLLGNLFTTVKTIFNL